MFFNVQCSAVAGTNHSAASPTPTIISQISVNGTLSITVNAAPAPGLPAPKILVMQNFVTLYQQTVNWGGTWNLVVPSGNYKIHPLPVSDGTNFYLANSAFIFVPPNDTANTLITYNIV